MFIKLLKTNETDHWCIDECPHKESVKTIWGVYAFDPSWRVHCCEMTASYELYFIETQVEFQDGVIDEHRDEIEDWFRLNDNYIDYISYMHCHTVDNAGHYREGWFPHESMGSVRLSGFAMGFEFDPNDQAERPIREQRHDYALLEAIEYCQQNAV